MRSMKLRFVSSGLALLLLIISVVSVLAEPLAQDDGPTEEPTEVPGEVEEPATIKENFFCVTPGTTHPVGDVMATTYGMTYEEVMGWFCEEKVGFGQIMLALRTAEMTGEAPDLYLERRSAGDGWGQIWKDLGLVGRPAEKEVGPPDHAGPDDDKELGPPDHAGPHNDKDKENGPPEHAGPHSDKDKEPGPPDHAGPHDRDGAKKKD